MNKTLWIFLDGCVVCFCHRFRLCPFVRCLHLTQCTRGPYLPMLSHNPHCNGIAARQLSLSCAWPSSCLLSHFVRFSYFEECHVSCRMLYLLCSVDIILDLFSSDIHRLKQSSSLQQWSLSRTHITWLVRVLLLIIAFLLFLLSSHSHVHTCTEFVSVDFLRP